MGVRLAVGGKVGEPVTVATGSGFAVRVRHAACYLALQARKVGLESNGIMMLTRRSFLVGCSAAALASGCAIFRSKEGPAVEELEALRAQLGGRLGVHALDLGSGNRLGLDADGRYAMASTFKLLLAAAVLHRVDRKELKLDQQVAFTAKDMVAYAPVAQQQLARGFMTVQELCAAIMLVSDNAAANLLLRLIGGPAEVTRFAQQLLEDHVTRLDRFEPELNQNLPNDPRDTTTPRAMVNNMDRLLIGDALRPASREQLIAWLTGSQTGQKRIRAGVPKAWKVGDKTGTGENGAVNDVAIATPPDRSPILIAIYMSESKKDAKTLAAAHASIARIISEAWA